MDYFENNALHAVVRNELDAFQEAISDVHNFYESQSKESAKKYLMIGLHLMYLLVTNRLSDFHMASCLNHQRCLLKILALGTS